MRREVIDVQIWERSGRNEKSPCSKEGELEFLVMFPALYKLVSALSYIASGGTGYRLWEE